MNRPPSASRAWMPQRAGQVAHQVQIVERQHRVVLAGPQCRILSRRGEEGQGGNRGGGQLFLRDRDHGRREIRAQVAGHVGRQPQGGAAGAAAQFQHMVALCQQFAGAPQRAFIALRIRDSGSRVSARAAVPETGVVAQGHGAVLGRAGRTPGARQHTPAPLAPGGRMPAGAPAQAGTGPVAGRIQVRRLTSTTSDTPRMMSADAATRSCVTASPRNSAPPNAVSTGTLSCTVAAWVTFSSLSAAYQRM